ncbi:MAG TPA: hypothetical protein VFA65_14540 [Bryobacteraceae bacterium]|nr:hypothetical protein [Bryobacteraceae bacterium]
MKSRAEALEKDRATVAELQEKYGLSLVRPSGENFYEEAVKLKLPRKVLSPPKTVIPCSVQLKDGGTVDPCLIIPTALPIELAPVHKAVAVAGQITLLQRSLFALPNYLIDEAYRAQGYWNGQPRPIVVSIRHEYKYLVRQKSYFFKFEKYRGEDIDHVSPMEPDERDLKLGRYYWGSDMTDELTLVIGEY